MSLVACIVLGSAPLPGDAVRRIDDRSDDVTVGLDSRCMAAERNANRRRGRMRRYCDVLDAVACMTLERNEGFPATLHVTLRKAHDERGIGRTGS